MKTQRERSGSGVAHQGTRPQAPAGCAPVPCGGGAPGLVPPAAACHASARIVIDGSVIDLAFGRYRMELFGASLVGIGRAIEELAASRAIGVAGSDRGVS